MEVPNEHWTPVALAAAFALIPSDETAMDAARDLILKAEMGNKYSDENGHGCGGDKAALLEKQNAEYAQRIATTGARTDDDVNDDPTGWMRMA